MNLVPGQSQFTDNKTWIVKMKYFPQGILTPGPTYPITPWLSSCRQSDKCFLPSGVTFMSGSLTGDFHPGQGWGKKWMALWLWGPWPFLGWRHYTGEVESSTPQIVYLMVEVREDQLGKFLTYKPSNCRLSKMQTHISSTSGVSEIVACPPFPVADEPSSVPSPTSFLSSIQ